MSNQYCHILSWIKHDKEHGDPKFAEAISDLCLDNLLVKSKRFPGLTFLYPTKIVRDKICKAVFTAKSREAVEEFKRYVLPDIFEKCESFNSKEVGNMLKYSYVVAEVKPNSVKFDNGMVIKPVESFNTLNPQIEDMVRIYSVTTGAPADNGEPYTAQMQHKTRGGTEDDGKFVKKAVDNLFLPDSRLCFSQYINSNGITIICVPNAFSAFNNIYNELDKYTNTTNNPTNNIDIIRIINQLFKPLLNNFSTCKNGTGLKSYFETLTGLVCACTDQPFSSKLRELVNGIATAALYGNGSNDPVVLYASLGTTSSLENYKKAVIDVNSVLCTLCKTKEDECIKKLKNLIQKFIMKGKFLSLSETIFKDLGCVLPGESVESIDCNFPGLTNDVILEIITNGILNFLVQCCRSKLNDQELSLSCMMLLPSHGDIVGAIRDNILPHILLRSSQSDSVPVNLFPNSNEHKQQSQDISSDLNKQQWELIKMLD